MNKLLRYAGAGTLAVLLGSAPVLAQDEALTEEELAAIAEAEAEAEVLEATEAEVINITGSAIQRKEVSTPAPITVVTGEALAASGMTNVGDILQDLPEAGGINSQLNNNSGTSLGLTTVSLRGLGSARTLVLLNGRRLVPGDIGAGSVADLAVIPIGMVERVDVLKDGASTIYGADAVGGVVNIITKKNYNGANADFYTGTSQDGGGTEITAAATGGIAGKLFGKRATVTMGVSYSQQFQLKQGQRDWARNPVQYDWDNNQELPFGSGIVPNGAIGADATPGNAAWGNIAAKPTASGSYTRDPSDPNPATGWRPFENPDGTNGLGDRYNFGPEQLLRMPSRRYNVMTNAELELDEDSSTKVFAEAYYSRRESDAALAPTPFMTLIEGVTVSGANPYNPFGRDFANISRRLVEFGPRETSATVDLFGTAVGVEGRIGDDWGWNVSGTYGRTRGKRSRNALSIPRLNAALGPGTIGPDGVARCASGDPDCVPFNLFGGAGTITQDQVDYLVATPTDKGHNQLWGVMAKVNGKLFDTYGGDARIAVGVEHRDSSGAFDPDVRVAAGEITGNKTEPISGDYNVQEAFAELSVVPIASKPGIEWLEVNGAARVSRYSNFGTEITYKGTGIYKIAGGLSVRGTYSTAFRAPTVADLFSGQSDSFDTAIDPCAVSDGGQTRTVSPTAAANCMAAPGRARANPTVVDANRQKPTKVGGNKELDPETARILTAGVTYEGRDAMDGVIASADYFRARLRNEIGRLGASDILKNCYESPESSIADCEKIIRRADGTIEQVNDTLTNTTGGVDTSGLELKLGYGKKTSIGSVSFVVAALRTLKYTQHFNGGRSVKGVGVFDLGVIPKWQGTFNGRWAGENLGAGFNVRYIGEVTECRDDNCHDALNPTDGSMVTPGINAGDYFNTDLFTTYSMKTAAGKTSLTLGVNNLFNQDPVQFYNANGGTGGLYDVLGRFFYVRLGQDF